MAENAPSNNSKIKANKVGGNVIGTYYESRAGLESEDRELTKLIQNLEKIGTGQLEAADAGEVAQRLFLLRLISSSDVDAVEYAVS